MNKTAYAILFLLAFKSVAQVPFFQQYNLLKKKESFQVNALAQDTHGFLWIGTTQGLIRFDGKNHKLFSTPDSITQSTITALAIDTLNRVWIGFEDGNISYLENNTLKAFKPEEGTPTASISDILFDRRGNMWFATHNDGLYYFTRNRLYRLDEEEGMPDLFVYDIEEDGAGNILAGTDGGLATCRLEGTKASIQLVNYKSGLPDNIIKKINYENEKLLWLATEDAGIIQFDINTRKSVPLLPEWRYGSVQDFVIQGNNAWIACRQKGLLKVELSTKREELYTNDHVKHASSINILLKDVEGNIWAGAKSGLFRTPGDIFTFVKDFAIEDQNNILAVTPDNTGNIWFSNHDGLHRRAKNKDGSVSLLRPLKNTPYAGLTVISLFTDNEGYIWAGLYGEGVLRIHPRTFKVRHLQKELRNGNILNISGKDNVVWLATLGGSSMIQYKNDELAITNYSVGNGLSSDFIYQTFIDSKGRTWFATDGKGVDRKDEKGFHHFETGLPSGVIYGLAEDSSGKLWANVQDYGLYFFNDKSEFEKAPEFMSVNTQEIHILDTDTYGNLLVAHDLGIDLINEQKKKTRFLAEDNGLREHFGNLNAVGKDESGRLFMGTSNGIVVYTPQEKFFMSNPLPQIEAIKVHDKFVNAADLIDLSYRQNNVTFNFVGLWFQSPENVFFRYKLENYDLDWISTKNNAVTYSSLPAGNYNFKVRVSASENFTDSSEISLALVVHPPFWKTPLFYLVVMASLLACTVGFIRYRERRLQRDKLVLEQRVLERTLEIKKQSDEIQAQNEEITSQAEEIRGINENLEMMVRERTAELERKNKALEEYAFINAHKLRGPLASILGLINLMNKPNQQGDLTEISKRLQQSADELDDVVRSITKAIERGDKSGLYDWIRKGDDD
jgi:ligand-binding sensor domain-containing protein